MINNILKFFIKDEHGLYGYHRLFNTTEYRQHLMDVRNRERALSAAKKIKEMRLIAIPTHTRMNLKRRVRHLNKI